MTWEINLVGKKPKLNKPIFLEGLPGIGNVGKVAVDFLIDELKAVKLYEIFSNTFPHSVFVNDDNLIELPVIEIYYKKMKKGKDLLFLAGDVQPIDEVSCHEFSHQILDLIEEYKGSEIITLGGIGLQDTPKKPKVYCTGNSKKLIQEYKKKVKVYDKLHGVVGPIVGVSGLLLGLAARRKIPAITLLAETYGHPMYLGVKGAREILTILDKKLGLGIKLKDLDKEIREIETEVLKRTEDLSDISKQTAIKKLQGKLGPEETSYIG